MCATAEQSLRWTVAKSPLPSQCTEMTVLSYFDRESQDCTVGEYGRCRELAEPILSAAFWKVPVYADPFLGTQEPLRRGAGACQWQRRARVGSHSARFRILFRLWPGSLCNSGPAWFLQVGAKFTAHSAQCLRSSRTGAISRFTWMPMLEPKRPPVQTEVACIIGRPLRFLR